MAGVEEGVVAAFHADGAGGAVAGTDEGVVVEGEDEICDGLDFLLFVAFFAYGSWRMVLLAHKRFK